MKNFNFNKDLITSLLGLLLVVGGLFPLLLVLIIPMFYPVLKDISSLWWIFAGITVVGIFLVISPDTLIYGAKKGIDKVGDSKENDKV